MINSYSSKASASILKYVLWVIAKNVNGQDLDINTLDERL